jgi:hypothetical protein
MINADNFGLLRRFFEFLDHVLDYTHSIFVTSELIEVLDAVVKELAEEFKRKYFYYLLDEVSGVTVDAEFEKVLTQFLED